MPPPSRCPNCGAPEAGPYCASCGQRFEPPILSMSAFARESLEGLTHADSRLWRTLRALLLSPGKLTSEFLAGRRARYLPPVRLYLVVSLAFFLIASLFADEDFALLLRSDGERTSTSAEAGKAERPLSALEELRAETERAASEAMTADERAVAQRASEIASTAASDPGKLCDDFVYQGPWDEFLAPRLAEGCRRATVDDGRLLGRTFMASIPTTLFIFLPLIALVMKALYWRPRRYYLEHLLFFVHNHSFAFLLFAALIPLAAALPAGIGGIAMLAAFGYCIWYFYRAMRHVYGQSRERTLAKYALLGMTYVAGGIVLTVLTILYSVLAL